MTNEVFGTYPAQVAGPPQEVLDRIAERRPRVAAMSTRLSLRRPADRPLPAPRLHLRRPPLHGLRRRHAGLGAARQRGHAGRAVLQVPPPARPRRLGPRGAERPREPRPRRPARAEPARHDRAAERGAGGAQPEPLAVARVRRGRGERGARRGSCRRGSTTRPSCGRAPSGSTSTSPRSAAPRGSAGRPTRSARPRTYEHFHVHVDVLVAGGGVAGLAAALAAGRAGASVLLMEQAGWWGGRAPVDGARSTDARRLLGRAGASPSSRRCRTCGCGSTAVSGALRPRLGRWPPSARRRARASGSGGSGPAASSWPPAPSSGRSPSPATTCRA